MQLISCTRIDVVWDTDLQESLKNCTRAKRGKGVRRKVSGPAKLPNKWIDFLHDTKNKEELFAFLTKKISESIFPPKNIVYVTSGVCVLHINTTNSMFNCNHEEADTRIVVHIHHALEQGMKKVEVRSVDTDVVIILVGVFYELIKTQSSADIWVAFGTGKNYRLLSINAICESLGEPNQEYIKGVLEDRTRSVHDPIKQNSLTIFK